MRTGNGKMLRCCDYGAIILRCDIEVTLRHCSIDVTSPPRSAFKAHTWRRTCRNPTPLDVRPSQTTYDTTYGKMTRGGSARNISQAVNVLAPASGKAVSRVQTHLSTTPKCHRITDNTNVRIDCLVTASEMPWLLS